MAVAENQRIKYIDFMKGLCITLIVIFHIDGQAFGERANYMLMSFRIPTYFFLSGLFFKCYDGFLDFTRHKVNNLVIPIIFFFFLGVLYTLCINLFQTHFDLRATLSLMPRNPINYNRPLWFLVCLFEVNIIYYLLQQIMPRAWTIVAALALSVVGYYIGKSGIFFFYVDVAFVALPYFVLGSESRKLGLLQRGPSDLVLSLLVVTLFVLLFFFAEKINLIHRFYPDYLRLYLLPFMSILTLLFVCHKVKKPVPVISHLGRYSIMVMATHLSIVISLRPVYAATYTIGSYTVHPLLKLLVFFVVIVVIEYILIYIFRRYFPKYTAQEEFFRKGWKLRDDKN